MSDLIKRLRGCADVWEGANPALAPVRLMREAATEIERLRAKLAELGARVDFYEDDDPNAAYRFCAAQGRKGASDE